MILILQQILPRYRYDLLKLLDSNKFIIAYSNTVKESSLRSVKASQNNFKEVPILKFGEKYIQNVYSLIKTNKPSVIVFTPELRNLTYWMLILLKFFFRYRLVAWTHGINNKDFYRNEISLTSRLRLKMINLADGVITYNQERATLLEKFTSNKIAVAPNTLNTYDIDEVYKNVSKKSKNEVKGELSVTSQINFVYVGRLIKEKNLDNSLYLLQQLHGENDIHFYIIGDGPDRKRLELITAENELEKNVTFLGSIRDIEILGKWLYISDLHLHLGYVGLAVVHSLAFGCPIVTYVPTAHEGPYHSPEFVYLNQENSIIANSESLAEKIKLILSDSQRMSEMRKAARATYNNKCSAHNFITIFQALN